MKHKRIIVGLSIAIVVLALVDAGLCIGWARGLFLPGWIEWNRTQLAADLNGDGYFEALCIEDRQLKVYEDGDLAAELPQDWFVSDVFVGDVDADGSQEVVCLTWKRGSYGESRPFWVEHNTAGFSQHIFIFQYRDGELVQRWLSSDIGIPVRRASLDEYARLHLETRDGESYLCEWQDWGLNYIDEDNLSMREADDAAVSFLAVGDCITHTGMLEEAYDPVTDAYDFSCLYENARDMISSYDLAAVNLETPLVDDPACVSGEYPVFGTPTSQGDALADAGFDIVCAATNHAGDQGAQGVEDTIGFWKAYHPDVELLGLNENADDVGRIDYREKDGIRFALFDCAYGLNDTSSLDTGDAWRVDTLDDADRLVSQLEEARAQADFSICFLHCGEEYSDAPTDEVEALVEKLVDAGADVVACTHPHVAQRTETVTTAQGNTGLVCYSLGNFVSDQTVPGTVLGLALSMTFEKPRAATDASVETDETTRGGGSEGAGAAARLSSVTVIPTVCHVADGHTTAYLLEDYTDEMARSHFQNTVEAGSVTLASLHEQWIALTVHDPAAR